MLEAILMMLLVGGILGGILGLASIVLYVKEDERIVTTTEMLPGYNCGACGFPGCSGLAEALVSGEETNVSACKPSKPDQRQAIAEYLNNAESPNGVALAVKA